MGGLEVIPPLLTHVTVDDVVRAGACRSGVRAASDRLGPLLTVYAVDDVRPRLKPDEREILDLSLIHI